MIGVDGISKISWLPIACNRNTSVLGYGCGTKTGRELWDELNWKEWWTDDSIEGWTYLKVDCFTDEKTYRVRCAFDLGEKYRGRIVDGVRIGMHAGILHWLVSTKETK